MDVDYLGDSYAGTLQFAHEGSPKMALSHMQALTPSLSLGGIVFIGSIPPLCSQFPGLKLRLEA